MVEVFVNEIQFALKNHSYFSALALVLTLPDICAYAEYPMEDKVSLRYISWYDKYIGPYMKAGSNISNEPYLSGELAYNLRNTYLHQGSPNVDAGRVKEESNQIDKFILVLGDGKIHTLSMNISSGSANVRMIMIDVTFLCKSICRAAMTYYHENAEKFHFNFDYVTEDELFGNNKPLDNIQNDDDPIGDLLLRKRFGDNHRYHYEANVTQQIMAQIKTETFKQHDHINKNMPAKSTEKKPVINKEEQRFRSFFGRTFPEKKFKEKKEQIVEAVATSGTKMGLNNRLMKIMPGEEVKEVLKRLKPFIKEWPGQ